MSQKNGQKCTSETDRKGSKLRSETTGKRIETAFTKLKVLSLAAWPGRLVRHQNCSIKRITH